MKKITVKFILQIAMILAMFVPVSNAAIAWRWEYGGNPDLLDAFMRNPDFGNMSMNTVTLANGWTIDNATNNALEWNENSEDLIWTISANVITLSSTTGITTMDFGAIVVKADQFLVDPRTAAVDANEGAIYYDSDDDNLYVKTTAGWVDLTAGASANTLDQAYDQGGDGDGYLITADSNAVTITNTDADDAYLLVITPTPSGPAATGGIQIVSGANSTQRSLDVNNLGSADDTVKIYTGTNGINDINGTSNTWYISKAGAATVASLSATTSISSTTTASVGTNLTVTGNATINGNTDIGNAVSDTLTITASIDGDLYFDDGAGAAPQIVFVDGSDETAAFNKTLTGPLNLTTQADDGLTVLVGNIRIGNAAPTSAAMDGEDLFVEGDMEVDGTTTHDGITVMNDYLDLNEKLDCDMDASDEYWTIDTSSTDIAALGLITVTMAAQDNQAYILRLVQTPDADADNDFLLLEDNAGDDKFAIEQGGTTTWTLDAGSGLIIDADTTANTLTSGVINLNVESATNGFRAIDVNVQLEDNATQAYGLYIDVDDDTTGGETFDGIYIANTAGTAATVRGLVLANTLDDGIVATIPAAGQAIVIDASTAHTETDGVVDIGMTSATNGASIINLDLEVDDLGASEAVSAIIIDTDDDTASAGAFIRGISLNASDVDGHASSLSQALYITGFDVAMQANAGYVKLGTGTPTIAQGDGDLFTEGSIEVNDVIYLQEGQTISGATDTRIMFGDNSEDFGFIFNGNTLTLATTTGLTGIDFNDIDTFSGLESIAGENGQTISFAIDNRIETTDNSETFGWIFDVNEIKLCTDSGVSSIDFNDIDTLNGIQDINGDNAQTINFAVNNQIAFSDNSETVAFDFSVANTLTLASKSTGVDKIDFNDIDELTDIELIDSGTDHYLKFTTDSNSQQRVVAKLSYVSATEIRATPPFQPMLCVGLAGIDEIGTAEGYINLSEGADFIRFSVQLPDNFIDVGNATDLVLAFDVNEQAAEECNLEIRIFEYGNTTPIITDTITLADGGGRQWVGLDTLSSGIGADADIGPEDVLFVELTQEGGDDAEDVYVYGVRLTYTVGVQNTQ